MKTFENEYEDLWTWFRAKTAENDEARSKEPLQLDGEAFYQRGRDVCVFNRRLRELKKKYGRMYSRST